MDNNTGDRKAELPTAETNGF